MASMKNRILNNNEKVKKNWNAELKKYKTASKKLTKIYLDPNRQNSAQLFYKLIGAKDVWLDIEGLCILNIDFQKNFRSVEVVWICEYVNLKKLELREGLKLKPWRSQGGCIYTLKSCSCEKVWISGLYLYLENLE